MRVLLAEDDELLGSGLKAGLGQQGFAVDWVRDGVAAERELLTQQHAVAVLDLGLPRQDGLDALAAVRAQGVRTPILILTTESGDDMKLAGKDAGATGWLVKPFDSMKLLEVIRMVIR